MHEGRLLLITLLWVCRCYSIDCLFKEPSNAALYHPMNASFSGWCSIDLPSHCGWNPNQPPRCRTNISLDIPEGASAVQITGSPPNTVLPCYSNTDESSGPYGACFAELDAVKANDGLLLVSFDWNYVAWTLYIGWQFCEPPLRTFHIESCRLNHNSSFNPPHCGPVGEVSL